MLHPPSKKEKATYRILRDLGFGNCTVNTNVKVHCWWYKCVFRNLGNICLNVNVDGCPSLCGPVMSWRLIQQKFKFKKNIFSAAQQADCKMLKSAKPSVYLLSADTHKRCQSFSSKKENFDSSSADLKLTWQSSCYCSYCSSLLSSSYSMSFGYLLKFAGFSRPALSHRATSQLPAEIRAQECVTAEEIAPVKW